MAADDKDEMQRATRLISSYLKAGEEDGLEVDAVMLCEVIGDEIQTIALRVAADSMRRMGASE